MECVSASFSELAEEHHCIKHGKLPPVKEWPKLTSKGFSGPPHECTILMDTWIHGHTTHFINNKDRLNIRNI
ncbi:hypothetical protein EWB00_000384 [Schistosoma japonicum]|uniref:Uncharacterized protein n=1 Tax=Schistosoma japonicum TaxID=6182 RepID=A0A4Z2CL11_SCHJA|nr:hypothetical protein EWB00_000384 [Schistosoma japonicum]